VLKLTGIPARCIYSSHDRTVTCNRYLLFILFLFFHLLTQAEYLTSDLGFFPQTACLTFASNIEPSKVELYGSMTLRVARLHFFIYLHQTPHFHHFIILNLLLHINYKNNCFYHFGPSQFSGYGMSLILLPADRSSCASYSRF